MDEDISKVCFLGIYGESQDQNNVLKQGLSERGVTVEDVSVQIRSVSEALEEKRLPIRTIRATMNWFGRPPAWLFTVLVVLTVAIHTVVITAVVVLAAPRLIGTDAIVVPNLGDTSVFAAKPVAILLGVPLVYFSHNGLYYTLIENRAMYPASSLAGRFIWWLDSQLHTLADVVVVFSDESGRLFHETFGVPDSVYETIYVNTLAGRFDTSVEPGVEHTSDALYWGNFLPHHGPLEMVESAAALPDKKFVFVGDSDYRQAVRERVNEIGAENARFPGFVSTDDLTRYIKGGRVVLGPVGDNPQTEFTVGTKVAEAAYFGKAIVVGDQPAIREVFTHGEDAYLVDPGNADAVTEAVEHLLSDEDLRQSLEEGARRTYEDKLSKDEACRRFLTIVTDASGSETDA